MNAIDLDIRIQSEEDLPRYLEMAKALGFSAVVSSLSLESKKPETDPIIYRRINLEATKLSTLKKRATSARKQHHIVAIPVRGVDTANWAAEDPRIDILSIDFTGKNVLRKTTANMSAKHNTALEVCIAPLLRCHGLERSKMIRTIHDSITVAAQVGMKIVLSSGARDPIHMRSPVALRHIGMMLGMDRKTADNAIVLNPRTILNRSIERMDGNRIGPGIKTIKGEEA